MGRSLQNPKNNVLEQVFPLCSFPTVGTPPLVSSSRAIPHLGKTTTERVRFNLLKRFNLWCRVVGESMALRARRRLRGGPALPYKVTSCLKAHA